MASEATQPALAPEPANQEAGSEPTHEEISARAHALWVERGCPDGSPEEDWLAAENELKSRKTQSAEA